VGDAAYFKDPITAHGITDALRDAELLADALAAGTERALARYREIRDGESMALFELSDQIASFEWSLPALETMHVALSDEMKREVAAMNERHATQALAADSLSA
jgi:flavin-dependent dehydrogenase